MATLVTAARFSTTKGVMASSRAEAVAVRAALSYSDWTVTIFTRFISVVLSAYGVPIFQRAFTKGCSYFRFVFIDLVFGANLFLCLISHTVAARSAAWPVFICVVVLQVTRAAQWNPIRWVKRQIGPRASRLDVGGIKLSLFSTVRAVPKRCSLRHDGKRPSPLTLFDRRIWLNRNDVIKFHGQHDTRGDAFMAVNY